MGNDVVSVPELIERHQSTAVPHPRLPNDSGCELAETERWTP